LNNWIKYKLLLLLGILLSSVASVAQNDSAQTEVRKKNAVYLSYGLRTFGTGVNYERSFYLSDKKPFMINTSLGVAHVFGYFGRGMTFPLSVDLAYGNKNRVYISGGIVFQVNFDPQLKTEEEINHYLTDPDSYKYDEIPPSLPYENMFNTGVGYERRFKYGLFIKGGFFLRYRRVPAYNNPNLKWRYELFYIGYDFGFGIKIK
tara:strand:+ start:5332 stop:5943 length:612 start_codon:yes stop_codon:yes gene_type:complete